MAVGNTLLEWTVPASAYPATNYPQLVLRNQRPVLAFDTTTQETCYFEGVMPQNYAGGNLTVYVYWDAATATSGTIGWGATWERLLAGTDNTGSDSFATEQLVSSTTVPGVSGVISVTNVVCTAGAAGTDSVAAGDAFRLRIRRDVATDTATGDANLYRVEIRES